MLLNTIVDKNSKKKNCIIWSKLKLNKTMLKVIFFYSYRFILFVEIYWKYDILVAINIKL